MTHLPGNYLAHNAFVRKAISRLRNRCCPPLIRRQVVIVSARKARPGGAWDAAETRQDASDDDHRHRRTGRFRQGDDR